MSSSGMNQDFVGKTYTSSPIMVTAEMIKGFALATNESNPRYASTDSAGPLVAPPFLPVLVWPELLQQLYEDPDELGVDPFRSVHAQQEMHWSGFVHSGDSVHAVCEIANIVPRGRHESLDMIVKLMKNKTKLVDMNFQILVLAEGGPSRKKSESPKTFEEPGRLIAEKEVAVAEDQGIRYARASGDMNPLHTDNDVARRLGFPGMILHGLCTLAISTQAIVDEVLEGDPTRLRYLRARFSNPVFMGQTVTTRVYADLLTEDELHSAQFLSIDSDGTPVVTRGIARFEV
jgi:acyl dehydratase